MKYLIKSQIRLILLLSALLAICPYQIVNAEDEFHSEIRETISQWAQTLKEIQTAEEDWKSESLLLEGQKESLAAEEDDLKNSIKLAKEERDSSDKGSVELVNKKKKLEDVTKLIDSEITKFENRILKLDKVLPRPLRDKIAPQYETMRLSEEKKKEIGSAKRVQNLLAAVTEIEKFQNKITDVSEIIKVKDIEQQVDTLYFGLSIAYAVNKTGDWAAIATGNSGWEFKERKELGEKIKQLVQIARKEGEIDFVELESQVK